ncbi:DUF4214 domain-containing protein [Marimonas sp. MJW-29]|uniref:DUF4214 domain-containing protein n=1 Tax=Sulfitobacter sediminis TaxID=3234186 RepID=A0ABV3RGS8_9RHOB
MPTIEVTALSEDAHVTALGIRDDTSSRGIDLAGALVTARYSDGTEEKLTWQALDAFTNGGATGTHVEMFFGFDVHELTTTRRLASLEIDLAPASSVFDITTAMDADPLGGSTPSSNNGFPFRVTEGFEGLPGTIAVTYSGIVNLAGQAALDDLYTVMRVDFTGLPGGGLLGELGWNSDIDTMRIAGDLVPESRADTGGALGDALTGTAAAEFFAGLGGDDTVSGGGGDDLIVGGAGADVLDGGTGIDTAAYKGIVQDFTLRFAPGMAVEVIHRKTAGEGTDRVDRIEWLAFSNAEKINLDKIDGVSALSSDDLDTLIEVYIAYFNRAPDALGLYFWGNALADGTSLEEIAALFLDQDETRATYPADATNLDFATQVYSNVLGRTADAAGLAFWQAQLDSGAVSRDVFILEVLRGATAAPPAGATQDFIDLQLADRAYLATKTDIGTYYAAIRGMSDVTTASEVMQSFERGDRGTVSDAVATIDLAFAGAAASDGGEMLLQLVGVVSDPFSGG